MSDLRIALHSVATDFQSRLGQQASTAWILERYARRCRRLRRSELTGMLAALRATDKRELALTRDAAVFLFDQGFEVLTEQPAGTHRYDIIGEPLLVEAKIDVPVETRANTKLCIYVLPGGRLPDRMEALTTFTSVKATVIDTDSESDRRAFLEKIQALGRAANPEMDLSGQTN
jgi:hypothetical protein